MIEVAVGGITMKFATYAVGYIIRFNVLALPIRQCSFGEVASEDSGILLLYGECSVE